MKPALATLLTTTAVLLAGCGTNTDPPPAPSTSATTPAPPTNAGPLEPTPPPHAYDDTKTGVIAFAKYYWTVVDYAQATGDTTLLKTLEAPTCNACDAGRRALDKMARRGGHVIAGQHRLVNVKAPFFGPKGAGLTAVLLTSAGRVTGAGDLDSSYPGGRQGLTIAVNSIDGLWRVAEMRFLN